MCIHVDVLVFFTCGTAYALLFDMASAPSLAPDQLAEGEKLRDCVCVEEKPSISE